MKLLLFVLGALAVYGAGYLTCAIRVAIINSKDWKRDDE